MPYPNLDATYEPDLTPGAVVEANKEVIPNADTDWTVYDDDPVGSTLTGSNETVVFAPTGGLTNGVEMTLAHTMAPWLLEFGIESDGAWLQIRVVDTEATEHVLQLSDQVLVGYTNLVLASEFSGGTTVRLDLEQLLFDETGKTIDVVNRLRIRGPAIISNMFWVDEGLVTELVNTEPPVDPPIVVVPENSTFTQVKLNSLTDAIRSFFGPQDHADIIDLPVYDPNAVVVSGKDALIAAVDSASPGDQIHIAADTYSWGTVNFGNVDAEGSKGGHVNSAAGRIWIMPRSGTGSVTFNSTTFNIYYSHIAMYNFSMTGKTKVNAYRNGIRATCWRGDGQNYGDGGWFYGRGKHPYRADDIWVDNNSIQNVKGLSLIRFYSGTNKTPIEGIGVATATKRGWVFNNLIKNHTIAPSDNPNPQKWPSIWIGLAGKDYHLFGGRPYFSWDQAGGSSNPPVPPSFLVENNRIDNYYGSDDEAWTIKQSGVWCRNNLLENSDSSAFSGRMCSKTHYTGNLDLSGENSKDALRMMGEDCTAYFNVLTGQRAIRTQPLRNPASSYVPTVRAVFKYNFLVSSGDWMRIVENAESSTADEDQPRDNVITKNVFCQHNATIGFTSGSGINESKWNTINPNGRKVDNDFYSHDGNKVYSGASVTHNYADVHLAAGTWDATHRGHPYDHVIHSLPPWFGAVVELS